MARTMLAGPYWVRMLGISRRSLNLHGDCVIAAAVPGQEGCAAAADTMVMQLIRLVIFLFGYVPVQQGHGRAKA